MNTDYAREFLVFAKSMNYSTAAKELFISRSTLRGHIAELEFELKVPLLDKSEESTKLTPYGRIFLDRAEELCNHVDGILHEFEDLKNHYANVRISYSTLMWLRQSLLKARLNVVAAHPEMTIDITTTGSPRTSAADLFSGTTDMVVFRVDEGLNPKDNPEAFRGLVAQKLETSRILFFTGIENPIAAKEHLTVEDLQGQTLLVSEDLLQIYQAHADTEAPEAFGMKLTAMPFNDFLEYYMADYSKCIGTVPEVMADNYQLTTRFDCKFLDVEGLDVRSDFYLACTREFLENPAARLFFEEVKHLASVPDAG